MSAAKGTAAATKAANALRSESSSHAAAAQATSAAVGRQAAAAEKAHPAAAPRSHAAGRRTRQSTPSARKKISGVCCQSECDEIDHTQVPSAYAAQSSSARLRDTSPAAMR